MSSDKKYDKPIIDGVSTDFIKLLKSILNKLFDVDLTYAPNVKRIYVDINSAVSILFHYKDIGNEDVLRELSDSIENFLSKALDKGLKIYILYTLAPSKVHRSIYPEWCKDREDRVSILKSDFIKKLLVSLKVFSEKNKSIAVVNCKDVHPIMVTYELDKSFSSQALIVSRDTVFKCFEKPSMNLYNGVEWINFGDNVFNSENRMFLSNPVALTPLYLTIRGDKRNEWSGAYGYGPVKTKAFIEKYKLKIKADMDYPLKEHITKYLPLYDITLMREKAKELKIDLTAFAKDLIK